MGNEIHYIAGKPYIKAKPIAAPTQDKQAPLMKYVDGCFYTTQHVINPQAKVDFHHIYFLCNEVKKGDYGFDTLANEVLGKCDGEDNISMGDCYHFDNGNLVDKTRCAKIIAATDKSLILPQPSMDYIMKCCGPSAKIKDILVEIEIYFGGLSTAHGAVKRGQYKPKVEYDNIINIKQIKQNWNRQELSAILPSYSTYIISCIANETPALPVEQWIEENL